MYVFYRRRKRHPFDSALRDLEGASDIERAMAANIRFDHRISKEREAALEAALSASLGTPASTDAFRNGFKTYCEERIQRASTPEFLDRGLNGGNIIDPPPVKKKPRISAGELLVNVLDLRGLRFALHWADLNAIHGWRGFVRNFPTDDIRLIRWLDRRLLGKGLAERRAFLTKVFAIANAYAADGHCHHPTWVTSWNKFEPLAGTPARWPELVGCEKPAPCWLVLLKYPISRTGGLIRPGQLEAGWNGYHYPSPPKLGLKHGGIVLDLARGAPARPPLCEYVHTQLELHVDDVVRLERIDGNGPVDLPGLRWRHRALLTKYHTPPTDWMP